MRVDRQPEWAGKLEPGMADKMAWIGLDEAVQGPGEKKVDWTQAESSAFPPEVPGARNG